jgi:hypothetical protein
LSADTITITAGRPAREGDAQDFSGPDGTYQVILSSVSDIIEEASRQPRQLRNGKPDPRDDGRWVYRIWTLAIEEGEYADQVLDLRANARSTGPKSKQFEIIAALLGRTPQIGESISIPELPGRSALALILTNENEYPYVKQLMPLPARGGTRQQPRPATTPVAQPRQATTEQPKSAAPLPF